MIPLLEVILPVFLIIGFGFTVAKIGWFTSSSVDGVMLFTQRFAIPCLLFSAMATIEIDNHFNFSLLLSYFSPSLIAFIFGALIGRIILKYPLEKCVVIGFCCLYSNALLLGLPIMEQAYGAHSLGPNYAIIAINTPFCYALGIIVMEFVKGRGSGFLSTVNKASTGIISNILVLSILLGLLVNISDIFIPNVVNTSIELFVKAAIPAAIFGLGGVLARYKLRSDFLPIICITVIALLAKPYFGLYFSKIADLDKNSIRAVVLTLGMAPGLNAFIFANMYNTGTRIATTSIIVSTALSIITLSYWLGKLV